MVQILQVADSAISEAGNKGTDCQRAAANIAFQAVFDAYTGGILGGFLNAIKSALTNIFGLGKKGLEEYLGDKLDEAEEAAKEEFKKWLREKLRGKPPEVYEKGFTKGPCTGTVTSTWDMAAGTYTVVVEGDCQCNPVATGGLRSAQLKKFTVTVTGKVSIDLDYNERIPILHVDPTPKVTVEADCESCSKRKTTKQPEQPGTTPQPGTPEGGGGTVSQPPPVPKLPKECDVKPPCPECMPIYNQIVAACNRAKELIAELRDLAGQWGGLQNRIAYAQQELDQLKAKGAPESQIAAKTAELTALQQEAKNLTITALNDGIELQKLEATLADLVKQLEECKKPPCGPKKEIEQPPTGTTPPPVPPGKPPKPTNPETPPPGPGGVSPPQGPPFPPAPPEPPPPPSLPPRESRPIVPRKPLPTCWPSGTDPHVACKAWIDIAQLNQLAENLALKALEDAQSDLNQADRLDKLAQLWDDHSKKLDSASKEYADMSKSDAAKAATAPNKESAATWMKFSQEADAESKLLAQQAADARAMTAKIKAEAKALRDRVAAEKADEAAKKAAAEASWADYNACLKLPTCPQPGQAVTTPPPGPTETTPPPPPPPPTTTPTPAPGNKTTGANPVPGKTTTPTGGQPTPCTDPGCTQTSLTPCKGPDCPSGSCIGPSCTPTTPPQCIGPDCPSGSCIGPSCTPTTPTPCKGPDCPSGSCIGPSCTPTTPPQCAGPDCPSGSCIGPSCTPTTPPRCTGPDCPSGSCIGPSCTPTTPTSGQPLQDYEALAIRDEGYNPIGWTRYPSNLSSSGWIYSSPDGKTTLAVEAPASGGYRLFKIDPNQPPIITNPNAIGVSSEITGLTSAVGQPLNTSEATAIQNAGYNPDGWSKYPSNTSWSGWVYRSPDWTTTLAYEPGFYGLVSVPSSPWSSPPGFNPNNGIYNFTGNSLYGPSSPIVTAPVQMKVQFVAADGTIYEITIITTPDQPQSPPTAPTSPGSSLRLRRGEWGNRASGTGGSLQLAAFHPSDPLEAFPPGTLVRMVPPSRPSPKPALEANPQAAGAPSFNLVANGNSSGEAFEFQVFDPTGKLKEIRVPDGLILEPLEPGAVKPVSAKPGEKKSSHKLSAYCVNYDKDPPDPNGLFRVAAPEIQEKYKAVRAVMRAGRELAAAGKLHPDSDPAAYVISIRQYAIWTRLENWDEQKFGEVFLEKTRKIAAESKVEWTKEMQQALLALVPGRWRDISMMLEEARKFEAAVAPPGR